MTRPHVLLALSIAACLAPHPSIAQKPAAPTHTVIGPGLHLLANTNGTLLVRIGPKESFVAGAQRPELVAAARSLLASLHAPAVRFAVALAATDAVRDGDGGWGASGAVTFAHEGLRGAIAGAPSSPLPTVGFSEVVQIELSGDEAHVVHQPAGYSSSDAIVHLEREGVLMMGGDYTSNGYPELFLRAGGTLNGMIQTVDTFVHNFGSTKMQFIPIRGPATNGAALREYHDMLVAVRDRVTRLIAAGGTEQSVVAAKPTAAFDAKWGHGPVSGDQFAAAAFHSLSGH
jgi:cyclase